MSRNPQITKLKPIWLSIISGIMWAASFPPFHAWFLAFFYLALLWFALEEVKSGKEAFQLGYLWGFAAAAITLWWICIPTVPGMIALVLFIPLYAALYSWLHHKVAHINPEFAVIISPVIFVAVEYIRSYGRFGFTWMNISYSQTQYPLLIQFADVLGNFGVSLWIAAINSCIYFLIKRTSPKKFWVATSALIVLFGSAVAYGIVKTNEFIDGAPVRIALLQGNVDPYKKWTREYLNRNAKLYSDMLLSVDDCADLCIMPETATACYHRLKPSMFSPILLTVMKTGIPTLTGSLDFDDQDRRRYFNMAMLIMPDGTYEQSYAKVQLVPFSEEVPFQEVFPVLRKLNFGGSHFSRGRELTIFRLDSIRFSVLICYESTFSWLCRKFRRRGAQFIVNITNDGWFGKTPGPYQHAMFNVMRAIENRCWIARCANTGISMFIDPCGKIVRKAGLFQQAVLTGTIRATAKLTMYDKMGDFIGWGALLATPIVLIISLKKAI